MVDKFEIMQRAKRIYEIEFEDYLVEESLRMMKQLLNGRHSMLDIDAKEVYMNVILLLKNEIEEDILNMTYAEKLTYVYLFLEK